MSNRSISVYHIALATFGVAPGGYKGMLDEYHQQYGEDSLTNTLLDLMGGSNAYLAEQIVNNLFGGLIGTHYPLALKAELVAWIESNLEAYGSNRGAFVCDLLDVIDGLSHTDPTWGALAKRFDNCISAAAQYQQLAGSRASTDLAELYQIMYQIDDNATSVENLVATWQTQFGNTSGAGSASVGSRLIISDDLAACASQLAQVISLNNETGILSTASLSSQVIAHTGTDAYFAAFAPARYAGSSDGIFTPQELGFSHLGSLPATTETMESLFYGTLIKMLKNIDSSEALALQTLDTDDSNGGDCIDDAILGQLLNILTTPASVQLIPDDTIADIAIEAAVAYVDLVGSYEYDNVSLFDGLWYL